MFTLFIGFSLSIFSQTEENDNDQNENTITSISIVGLKKTKLYVMERYLQKYLGRTESDIDINDVYATIKSTGVLEPISIEIIDNQTGKGKTLLITVREKWTIFPMPYFAINSGNWSVGGVIAETNAFGLMDMVNLGGGYGSDSWSVNLMYMKMPKAVGDFGFTVLGMFMNRNTENTEQTGNDVLRQFNSITLNPKVSVSYKLTELIIAGFDVSYHYVKLTDMDNPVNAPEDGIHALGLSPHFSIRKSRWDGFLISEKSISLGYNYRFIIGADDAQSVSLNCIFSHPIIPGFLATAKAGLLYSTPSVSPFFESMPISPVKILSSNYSALNYAAASLGLEKYLFKFSFGTISLAGAYQVVYSDGVFLKHQFDHGPVVTAQMYFSRLAFPALGLGTAYNVDKSFFQLAANFGFSF